MTPNKQLQPTVIPNRWRAASASFHYALAARWTAQRAAARKRSGSCKAVGMNLEGIYFVVQIIAGVAVIGSLIYLARQLRQNTDVARTSMRHQVTNAAMLGGQILADNGELAKLLQRLNAGEALEPHENLRLQALAFMVTRNWENIHYQYLNGMVTDSEWAAFRKNLLALFLSPLWQDYWRREHEIYTDRFRSEVEDILSEIQAGKVSAASSALLESKR